MIVSPFLSKRRISLSLPDLLSKKKNGVNVLIVTRDVNDFKESDQNRIKECITMLTDAGLEVIYEPKIHQKFAVIDQKLVWYGSINLLSYGASEESIMRLESTSIALELEKTVL